MVLRLQGAHRRGCGQRNGSHGGNDICQQEDSMDKHFVLSKIKDYEAHLDNVAPLMESDDQLIMNEFAKLTIPVM